MYKPNYISQDDARLARLVDSMDDLLGSRFNGAEIIHYPRRVIGDFNALARWIDSSAEKKADLRLHDLRLLRDRMLYGERYAIDQVLKDVNDIEAVAQKYKLPLDVTVSVLKGRDEVDVECGPYGLVRCSYLGRPGQGFALTDIWRQVQAGKAPQAASSGYKVDDNALRLALVAK